LKEEAVVTLTQGATIRVAAEEAITLKLTNGRTFESRVIRSGRLAIRPSNSRMTSEHVGSNGGSNTQQFVRYNETGNRKEFTVSAQSDGGSFNLSFLEH